jgi:hypothetical protein
MRTAPVFALLLFLISACEQVDETPVEIPGPEYFPLETGSYMIYNVDSTRTILNVPTSYSFQLRISVGNSFVNGEGNTSYIIQREKRADPSKAWTPAGTWTAWKSIRQAVVSEGNVSYVKLQFPLSTGIQWNGNALNGRGGDERCNEMDCDRYEVTETEPDVVVTQSNDPDEVLKKDIRIEMYRKDVGLVYKESSVIEYCDSGDCFGTGFVRNGLVYKQEMVESGTF